MQARGPFTLVHAGPLTSSVRASVQYLTRELAGMAIQTFWVQTPAEVVQRTIHHSESPGGKEHTGHLDVKVLSYSVQCIFSDLNMRPRLIRTPAPNSLVAKQYRHWPAQFSLWSHEKLGSWSQALCACASVVASLQTPVCALFPVFGPEL